MSPGREIINVHPDAINHCKLCIFVLPFPPSKLHRYPSLMPSRQPLQHPLPVAKLSCKYESDN